MTPLLGSNSTNTTTTVPKPGAQENQAAHHSSAKTIAGGVAGGIGGLQPPRQEDYLPTDSSTNERIDVRESVLPGKYTRMPAGAGSDNVTCAKAGTGCGHPSWTV